jgi:hypothetical protein
LGLGLPALILSAFPPAQQLGEIRCMFFELFLLFLEELLLLSDGIVEKDDQIFLLIGVPA